MSRGDFALEVALDVTTPTVNQREVAAAVRVLVEAAALRATAPAVNGANAVVPGREVGFTRGSAAEDTSHCSGEVEREEEGETYCSCHRARR